MFIEELRDLNIKFLEYRKGRYWQREQGPPTVTYINSTSKSPALCLQSGVLFDILVKKDKLDCV